MYSSPATPAGTGHSHRSSTNSRVLATADPTGGSPSPAGTAAIAVITVASVGPYACTSDRPGAHAAASRAVSGSDPAIIRPTDPSPAGSSTSSSDGTTLAASTPARVITAATCAGSDRCAAVAITSVAPAVSVTTTSSTDASKLNDANCSTRAPGPAPSTGPSPAARFTALAWATPTPFGVPVDPEV